MVKKNIIANYIGQGWVAMMGLAFIPLYVKYIGVEAYGLIGIYTMLQAWLSLLDMGLMPTMNREMARMMAGAHSAESIRDLLRSLELIYLFLSLLIILTIWFGGSWIANGWLETKGLPMDVVIRALQIMGIALSARWIEQVYRAALQGLQDQVWLNGSQVVLSTLRWAGAFVIVAFLSSSIVVFFIWQALISIISFIVLIARMYKILPKSNRRAKFNISLLKEIKQFAGGMFLSSFLVLLLTQTDKLVITKLLTLEQFGYYSLAYTIASGLTQLILPMNAAIYPKFTELATLNDEIGIAKIYEKATQWMSAIIIPIAIVIFFFSKTLLFLWTGDSLLSETVSPILKILILGMLCNGLMNVPHILQLSYGWVRLSNTLNIIAVFIIVPAIIWAVPKFGPIGAAYVWFFLNTGYVIINAQFMHKRLLQTRKWEWYKNAIARPLIFAVLIGAILKYFIPLITTRFMAALVLLVVVAFMYLVVIVSLPLVYGDLKTFSIKKLRTKLL